MELRLRTNIKKNRDPLRIGEYNYNLGIKNKTELQALYRQFYIEYGLPPLENYYSRNQIIKTILDESRLREYFTCIGKPTHANRDAIRLNEKTDSCILEDSETDIMNEVQDGETLSSDEDFIEYDSEIDSQASFETESDVESEDYTEDDCSDDEL